MITITENNLRELTANILTAAGVPADKAGLIAEPLVATNLRGVDSHGVQLLPHYISQVELGNVSPHAEGHVVSENGSCLVYDGEHGFGQITSRICCAHAARLAARNGLGMVTVREANHFGAAASWAQMISSHGYIGVCMCDASMQVPPWQGREPRLGTNPICVSVPSPNGNGWLLDMATSTVALGKLEQSWLKGEKTLPYGWALDNEGVPTTDTGKAYNGGLLAPLGGYKGSGLGTMVELFCGVLAGGEAYGPNVTGIRNKTRPVRTNQMFLAIDVSRFMPLDEFHTRMDWLVAQIKSARPAKGYDEVLVAGEPEQRAEQHRRRHGIPIPDGVWKTVAEVAERLHVPLPQHEIA